RGWLGAEGRRASRLWADERPLRIKAHWCDCMLPRAADTAATLDCVGPAPSAVALHSTRQRGRRPRVRGAPAALSPRSFLPGCAPAPLPAAPAPEPGTARRRGRERSTRAARAPG